MTQSILTFHGRLVLWGDTSTCLPIRGLSTHLNDQRTVTVFVLENVLTSPMRVFSRLEIRNLQVCSRHVWTDGPIDFPVSVWKQTWLVSVFFFCVWVIWRGFLMCRQGETTDALWWICLEVASCSFRNVLFFDLLTLNRGTGDFVPEDFQWEIMMSWRDFNPRCTEICSASCC